MKNQIDETLIHKLSELARKERKTKEFKGRVRVKGKIIKKGKTKKENIRLTVKKGEDKYNFVVVKTHKENYALAEKLKAGDCVSAVGINRFRAIICTQLKQIKQADESRQTTPPFTK